MKTRILLLLAVLQLSIACKKEKTEIKDSNIISISGISHMDRYGVVVGSIDNSDWTLDLFMPDYILALLDFQDTMDYSNSDIGDISIMEYPNPIEDNFILNISNTQTTILKFIIVDDSLNVLGKQTIKLNRGINQISYLANHLKKDKYYRLYYSFYDKNKVIYFKGHGDIYKEN